LQDKI